MKTDTKKIVTHQQPQLVLGRTPGVNPDTFVSSDVARTIVYNPYDLESVFAAAILSRHFQKSRAVAVNALNVDQSTERHLWVGIKTPGKLDDFFRLNIRKSIEVQTLTANKGLIVDEVGIGPSLLTTLSEEFGIRTERYEKLFYCAQWFYRKDAPLAYLGYVYKNMANAFKCLWSNTELFSVSESSEQDCTIYLNQFKDMQNHLQVNLSRGYAMDGSSQVKVCSIQMGPMVGILAARLFALTGLSYMNEQTSPHGILYFTNMKNPILKETNGKTLVIN